MVVHGILIFDGEKGPIEGMQTEVSGTISFHLGIIRVQLRIKMCTTSIVH